jgi:hypothetical protein
MQTRKGYRSGRQLRRIRAGINFIIAHSFLALSQVNSTVVRHAVNNLGRATLRCCERWEQRQYVHATRPPLRAAPPTEDKEMRLGGCRHRPEARTPQDGRCVGLHGRGRRSGTDRLTPLTCVDVEGVQPVVLRAQVAAAEDQHELRRTEHLGSGSGGLLIGSADRGQERTNCACLA